MLCAKRVERMIMQYRLQNQCQRFLSLLMLTVLSVLWQSGHAQRFSGKLIGGINASQIEGDGIVGFNQPGIYLGGGASFPLTSSLSFEPEFVFSQKGSRTSLEENDRLGRYFEFRLNYLEMPLLLNYYLRPDLDVIAGFSPAILLNARTTDLNFDFDVTNRFSRIDYGMTLGAEYIAWKRLGIQLRWTFSVVPANQVETNLTNFQYIEAAALGQGLRNNTLSFSLRYILGLGEGNDPKQRQPSPETTQ